MKGIKSWKYILGLIARGFESQVQELGLDSRGKDLEIKEWHGNIPEREGNSSGGWGRELVRTERMVVGHRRLQQTVGQHSPPLSPWPQAGFHRAATTGPPPSTNTKSPSKASSLTFLVNPGWGCSDKETHRILRHKWENLICRPRE